MMDVQRQHRATLLFNIARAAFLLLIVGAIIWYFASGREFSVESILNYTPDDYFLAALFMIVLYIIKSLLVFPPIMALQIAVGLYFPTWAAVIVNLLGITAEFCVGYMVGRAIGLNMTDKLLKKHPKVREIVESAKNRWFISYILRALNMLPMDIVSMYLGTSEFPFGIYLTGSLAGALFGVLAATFIGMSLTDPTSPTFIAACAISITLSVISCVIYYFITHKKGKSNAD